MAATANARHQPFGAGGIDDRAAGHLPDQADDAADRQHKADLDLGPFLGRQVNRDEGPEPGLHIGEKEDEPVEAAQALARRRRRSAWLRRHVATAANRSRPIVVIDNAQSVWGCAREQDALFRLF